MWMIFQFDIGSLGGCYLMFVSPFKLNFFHLDFSNTLFLATISNFKI